MLMVKGNYICFLLLYFIIWYDIILYYTNIILYF